jgi:hypothetical protein
MRKFLFRFSLIIPVMILVLSITFSCIKVYGVVKKALAIQEETIIRELSEIEKIKNFFYENLGNGVVFHKLWTIFECESGHRQDITHTNYHKSGRCKPTSTDWGIAMINDCYWDETAKSMGLDYKNNVYDNLLMAKYIYDVGGITQWVCYNNGYK